MITKPKRSRANLRRSRPRHKNLVTNNVKHAFEREGGAIQIQLLAGKAPGVATLMVKDNGKGFDKAKTLGSGLRLVRALADQIRGRIEQETSSKGTTTRLVFAPRNA